MISQVDAAGECRKLSSTPTLPVLQEGRANLVSPPQGERTPSLKETAALWASDVRKRLSEAVSQGEEVNREDVHILERELVFGFITALQQDNHKTWMLLREMLSLIEPYSHSLHCFDQKAELYHYLERIVHHAHVHKSRLFDVQITEALARVFPKEVEEIKQSGRIPAKKFCSPSPPLVKAPSSPRKAVKLTLPDGSDPFDLRPAPDDETYLVVKPLTFGDVRKSFGAVAMEVASREAVWGQCLGTTVQALQIDLPGEPEEGVKTSPPLTKPSPAVTPRSTDSSPETKKQVTPRKPMTGREAVQYFAGCHHLGKIQTLYFNLAPNRYYRPYDLIEVPENKVNAHHYVFSTFSIMHVHPDAPSETMGLADWHREAVLWNAISHIPFFKHYLLVKMFRRWRSNKQKLDLQRRQEKLMKNLLHAVPRFGAALLQLTRLLKELLTVNFLPLETGSSYTLTNFENLVNYKNVQADKTLEKFFKYCKLTVDVTAEESFKCLSYCEEQVQKKTVFSKDSLHLQRLKKEQREENLQKARTETGRLGNFVKLIDQMVVEHLFEISKCQVLQFVNKVMKSRQDAADQEDKGMIQANLVFTKQGVLGLSPSKERIFSVITGTLTNIPGILCAQAMPMDTTPAFTDRDDQASVFSSPTKSTASLIKVLEQKRKKSLAMTPATAITTGQGSEADTAAKGASFTEAGVETQSEATSRLTKSAAQPVALLEEEDKSEIDIPDLPRWAAPTKEEDEMGVATPDLVIKTEPCLIVEGEGFMGQYEPLSRANLEDKLRLDKEYLDALDLATEMLEAAMLEVDQYCEANAWLNQIHQFTAKWTERSVREFKGLAAFTIEQKLTEIRQWSDSIRAFDQNYLTENGLIYIDCVTMHSSLVPTLEAIYQQLVTFVADEAKQLAKDFCKDISFFIYTLKDKRKTVEAFASYAKSFNEYKNSTYQYQQQLDYIKSLYEVIRMSYRQLTGEEEKLEESMWTAWEAFLYQMQAAAEFVNTQTPLFSQELEDTYMRLKHAKTQKQQNEAVQPPSRVMVLEKQAYELTEQGTSGKFLDPAEKPTAILADLKEIRLQFFSVREQLTDAAWRREAISGEPYDLTFLSELTKRLDVRCELWKYVEVSMLAIQDWKQLPFKKFNTRKALEKMVEWQTAAGQLKAHLPSEDAVLAQWFRSLQDFKTKLPLLHKLHHESLKERHWKTIFVGIGDVYDPKKELLLSDILEYKLDEQVQFIDQVCQNALAEYDLEVQITKLAKFWSEREFKLAKHIPDSVYSDKDFEQKRRQSIQRRSKLEKFRQERATNMKGSLKFLDVKSGDLYILVEVEQLQYELEDSQISVHAMLHSPHLAGMEHEVRFWSKALHQIQEITELWLSAQEKWLYLLKVFEIPEMYKKFSDMSLKFENVNRKFKDYMRIASTDPKCVSVINHKRGEKGYRLLQGDNLRKLLTGLISTQEEILKHLEDLLNAARHQFPRLFFLSNWEVVEALGVSRNPQALLPTVSKCFPGISGLHFSLPPGLGSVNSTLDYALHADKLMCTALTGNLGERLELSSQLEAYPQATKWLSWLEKGMRNSLAEKLQATVQARLEDGAPQPVQVLRELVHFNRPKRGQTEDDVQKAGEETLQHWLLRYPVQCVVISEAVLWERSMTRVLEREEKNDLPQLRSNLQSRLEQYTDILKEEVRGRADVQVKQRLRQLVSNLVNQGIYHRDIIQALTKSNNVSLQCFDWLKVLKYHIDIKSVLRAKTEVSESSPLTPKPLPSTPRRRVRLSEDKTEEEPPLLTRTKTTISSSYSFSQCFVHMLGSPYSYDYEYLGATPRLVVTPLTERAFLSLTLSLQSFHCGALVGPPSMGKSETIRELSKAMGRHLVTVSCNEDVSLPMMTQYLSGTIQTGSWLLLDNAGCLTAGLMSVFAQQLDYLRTALKALSEFGSCQYNLRGQPRYDKYGRRVFYDIDPVCQSQKPGVSDKVIRRNSLTTLHPLPPEEDQPSLLRQNTVPHGFNEKGLSTYFEDRWVEERERRHSIEKEILIKESELYKSHKPPPLFYEHVMFSRKKSSPDYSKLGQETSYQPHYLGNVLFNGNLMLASANFGCFMTFNSNDPSYSTKVPQQLRVLIRPCALVVPDTDRVLEVLLCSEGFEEFSLWTSKLSRFLYLLHLELPGGSGHSYAGLKELKTVVTVAGKKRLDKGLDREIHATLYKDADTLNTVMQSQTPRSREEFCIVQGIRKVISPRIENEDDSLRLLNILRDLFPSSAKPESPLLGNDPKLTQAIKDLLRQNHQFSSDTFIAKILQLQAAVDLGHGVILSGPSGSGKTTCYQTLAKAWNHLNYKLFAPDHAKEELDIHKMIRKTQHKQNESDGNDPYSVEIKHGLVLEKLSVETREARVKWKRAEKSMAGILSTTLDTEATEAPTDQARYPKVGLFTVMPNSLTPQQLFGSFEKGLWDDGILTRILRSIDFRGHSVKSILKVKRSNKPGSDLPSNLLQWLVLDGAVNPAWSENLNTLLDESRRLNNADRENIKHQSSATVLFETTNLSWASPAMVARTTVVHFDAGLVQWKWLFDNWASTCKTEFMLTTTCIRILDQLVTDVFGPTLKFLANECLPSLLTDVSFRTRQTNQVAPGIQEVTTFLKILSSLLSKYFLREDLEKKIRRMEEEDPEGQDPSSRAASVSAHRINSRLTTTTVIEEIVPNHLELLKSMFAFSYIWAFGGHIHDRYKEKFDRCARETLFRATHPVRIPSRGLVYDFYVDASTGGLVRWSDKPMERPRGLPSTYVVTPEVDRYHYLIDLLLSAGHCVHLTGGTGVGKTSVIQHLVSSKHALTRIQMSPGLTSERLGQRLLSRLTDPHVQQSGSGLSLDDKDLTFFIDDLHTAQGEHGVQPSLELLRQLLTEGSLYDVERKMSVETKPARLLTLSTLPSQPGSGCGISCQVMSARLTRLLVTLTYFELPLSSLLSIMSKPILSWLEEFPTHSVEHHKDFANALAAGLYEIYTAVKEKFRPTPAHAHYLFSFHNVALAIQGLLLMSPRSRTRRIKVRRRERKGFESLACIGIPDFSRQSTKFSSDSDGGSEGCAPMMKSIAQLWCHECNRVFADRLIDVEDISWYHRTLETVAVKYFCSPRIDRRVEMTSIHEEQHVFRYGQTPPVDRHSNGSPGQESHQGTSPMPDQESGRPHGDTPGMESPVSHPGTVGQIAVPEVSDQQPEPVQLSPLDSARKGKLDRGKSPEKTALKRRSLPDDTSGGLSNQTKITMDRVDRSTNESTRTTNLEEGGVESARTTTDTEEADDLEISSEDEASSSEENLVSSSECDTEDTDADTPGMAMLEDVDLGASQNSQRARAMRRVSKQGKRGVTFKTGLISDAEQEEYDGPLMTYDELKGPHKSLADILYSKHFMRILTESRGEMVEKGYVEMTESQLTNALYLTLRTYNTATGQHLDLAFFTQAVQHAARLSRVMSLSGGHALLLGVSYSTGRGTLAKLAAFIAQRKVFEPKPQSTQQLTTQVTRQHIRRCCNYAGVTKKPAVLLINEALGEQSLRDVTAVMTEGTCPGLYNEEELQDLISQMMPGGVQIKRADKIDQAFDRFLKKVRQNLHVVVCLNYRGNSFSSDFNGLYSKLQKCPGLLKQCAYVDVYREWDKGAYVTVANRWLRYPYSKLQVPWNDVFKEEQINLTSAAMAYIHMTAKAAVEQQYCHHREPLRFYTPLTFMEFTRIFRVVSVHLAKREQATIEKYQVLLGKMNQASATIAGYKREVSELTPKLREAHVAIRDWLDKVEEGKKAYIQQLEDCKSQEEKIASLLKPMDHYKEELSSAFDKARPSYEAAKLALAALDEQANSDLGELKSYRAPPVTVKWVVGALCVLFDKPDDWDSGKQLLLKDNLIDDLIFYDKEHIPQHIFTKLEAYVKNPRFTPEEVKQSSSALACMCSYIHAVYQYAIIHRGTFPLRQNLSEAVSNVEKAQASLGQMRLTASRRKSQLQNSIDSHKEAVRNMKAIEKQVLGIEKRIKKCNELMTRIKSHHTDWKSEVKKCKTHIDTAPADALITAACVCYFGPLDDKTRADLLQDWIKFCRSGGNAMSSSLLEERESLDVRLQNFMAESLSIHSHGGSIKSEPNEADSLLMGEDNAGQISRPNTSSSRVSGTKGDNPPTVHVYPYRPSIQESSLGKGDLRSELEEAGSSRFSMETDESAEEDSSSSLVLRRDFSLQEILSDVEELQDWKLAELPMDTHAIQNALITRVCSENRKHFWPLLIDPDSQAEAWVRALQRSSRHIQETHLIGQDVDTSNTLSDSLELADYYGMDEETRRMSRFSDVTGFTDFTLADDATIVSEYRTQRSVSVNANRDDLRPMTSVTQSWENKSDVRVEEEVEPPTDNLWVVEADHPLLGYHLVNAAVHGVALLVTHLERKPLDTVFREILFKQHHVDSEGNRVVRLGGVEYHYHHKFKLYLSTSTPLFMKGDGLFELPIQKMCLINMGLSDEAIVARILHQTMEVEKREYHAQLLANDNDIVQHNKKMAKENEIILEKVYNLDYAVLRDQTILPALQMCEQNVAKHRSILEEATYMRETLEQKRVPYVAMAHQVATLYALVRKMTVLHPLYYLPFEQFTEIFTQVLHARNRGKGVAGDILARTQELSDATTASLYKFVTMMMFEKHVLLFSLLVAMERMRLKGQLTNEEMALFINGFEVRDQLEQASQLADKPAWTCDQSWLRCVVLESLHQSFRGLQASLIQNSALWEEYFNRPLTLMNPVPGEELKRLTAFQKCLLWKIFSPDKLSEVTQALVVYELGAIIQPPDHYNIREVYQYTDKSMPTLFVYPDLPDGSKGSNSTKGFPYVDPLHELKRLAREEGMEGRLRILNFGVPSQMAEVSQAIEDCMNNGYWILLENYHLAEPLDRQTFQLLKTIIHSKSDKRSCSSMLEDGCSRTSDGVQSAVRSLAPSPAPGTISVCDTFRLFITTSVCGRRLPPGLVIQHGLKVSCENTGNFRSSLQKAYRNVAYLLNSRLQASARARQAADSEDKSSYIMPLALLHAVLLQRRYYGNIGSVANNYWSVVDLVSAAEIFKSLSVQCNCMETVSEVITQVYSNYCTDLQDSEVVKAIGAAILKFPGMQPEVHNSDTPIGCACLLDHLLSEGGKPVFNLKSSLDSLHELNASTFSLPDSADQQLAVAISRSLSKDMIQTLGAPELLTTVVNSPTETSVKQCLRLLEETLTSCPQLPDTSRDQLYPLDVFFHYETQKYRTLLRTLQDDSRLLLLHAQGQTTLSEDLLEVRAALACDEVPGAWLTHTFPSGTGFTAWIQALPHKLGRLVRYLDRQVTDHIYDLSTFLHPGRFLQAALQDYARQQFKNAEFLQYQAQVMPAGFSPCSPPASGLYVRGLRLHNATWDRVHSRLADIQPDRPDTVLLPLIWLSPCEDTSCSGPVSSDSDDSSTPLKTDSYFCPVFCGSRMSDVHHSFMVTRIALAAGSTPKRVWYQFVHMYEENKLLL